MVQKNTKRFREVPRFDIVDDAMVEVLRQKTPAQRVAIAFGLNQRAREAIAGVLRHQHPDWDDARILAQVARRMTRGSE